MSNLPVNVISPEAIMSDRFRIHMVEGDGHEPDLKSRRDYVVLAPVSQYCGEGLYLIDCGMGPALYQAQGIGRGQIRIRLTNPTYRDEGRPFTKKQFDETVLGFVVADIKVRDECALREIMEGARR